MKKENVILHSDMNSFYASVEMMLNPSLKGKPVAVCGSTENRHGIVLAKSDLAKKCGIKTGMVNWEARQLCSDLVMVEPQYDQYMKYSNLAREIYYRYTDMVEPFGMDECWLDVTDSGRLGSGMKIAREIRSATKRELGLTVSVGVSFNKIFAKLGSDLKKPDAITMICRDNFRERVWPLDIEDMIFCGRSTGARLRNYGIFTLGELAMTEPRLLQSWFGINGLKLWNFANGNDSTPVMHRDFVSPVKSVGHGTTCLLDLETDEQVHAVILELSQDIGHRLKTHGLRCQGVQLTVRDEELFHEQYQCRIPFATQCADDIAAAASGLFYERYRWLRKIRSVTVRAISLVPGDFQQQLSFDMDAEKCEKKEALDNVVEGLRSRFGKRSVIPATLLNIDRLTAV